MSRCRLFVLIWILNQGLFAPSYAATIGDYRTKSGGNWNQISIWEYYNGSSWVNAVVTPTYYDGDIDINSGHTVTVTANVTIDHTSVSGVLIINSGITVTINDGISTDLSVSGLVRVYGTIVNYGSITSDITEMVFYTGSLYKHARDGSSVPDATWNDGSTCEITGIVSSGSLLNTDQSFFHFTWNCPLQSVETNCAGNLQIIRGNFNMISTGTSGRLKLAESADFTLTISGNWDHQGGTLNMGGGSSYAYINLAGNFSMSGGKITEYNSTGYTSKISFTKQGIQSYLKTSGIFENTIDFSINGGTTLDVGTSVVDGSTGQFQVNSGSTLKTAHVNGISTSGASGSIQTLSRYYSFAADYHYYRSGAQSSGNGIPSPLNGKLLIGSTTGTTNLTLTNGAITIHGTLILYSDPVSNSSITTGNVVYGAEGTLEYQGLSLQSVTNKEWPIANPPFNVIFNNGYGVTLTGDRAINGTINLAAGSFFIGSNTMTLNGTLIQSSGFLTGGSGSNISIGGASPTALDLSAVALGVLTLNRVSGVRLTGHVTIYGNLTMTNGQVTLMPSKTLSYMSGSRLKYNGTSNQTTATEEFPVTAGPPSLEVDKAVGTTLYFSFSRTLSENLYLAEGTFSIGNNTLTLNGFISTTGGFLTGGQASNLVFAPGTLSSQLPSVELNNLTINRDQGITLAGNCTIFGVLSLLTGDFSIGQNGTLSLMGTPITGDPMNLKSNLLSNLIYGGNQPGHIIPASIQELNQLTINNTSDVSLETDIVIQTSVKVGRVIDLNNHVFSGPGMIQILPAARLITGHPEGISGNIQTTGPVFISGDSDVDFNGNVDQLTGFLPTDPPETIRNLTIRNAAPGMVSLNSNIRLTGNLVVMQGATFVVEPGYTIIAEQDVMILW
jgi:hypothetical protein